MVTAHVTIWLTMASRPFSFNWWLGGWIFYACFFSIPVFVMVSGALLLDDARQESPLEFYRKRMVRVGVPLVVWTTVYLFVRAFIDHETLTLGGIVQLILTGDPYYHLWFLYMILGLYLVTPPLRTFVRHATRNQRLFVIAVILVLSNAHFQTDNLLWQNQRSIFTMFIPYLGYYLCGYELSRVDPRKIPAVVLLFPVLICAIYPAVFAEAFIARQGGIGPGSRFVFDFFTPPILFLSIAVFWAAWLHDAKVKPPTGIRKAILEWVASTTLGVYVLHPLVLTGIGKLLSGHRSTDATQVAGDGTFVAGIIFVPFVAFVICCLLTSMMMKVPLLRRTVC
ncbi:MAG: hypothetical protein A2Y77_06800 [Planctomycetes bacterium RBG_13_62_9]|nr:MAG: hypothetical protein A2Y77_06800 [Planctomycetes bacterium RBG_13_62_9]